MAQRWQRFGLAGDTLNTDRDYQGVANLEQRLLETPYRADRKHSMVIRWTHIFVDQFLANADALAQQTCTQLVNNALEYFFGEWRKPDKPNRGPNYPGRGEDYWGRLGMWHPYLECALCASAGLRRWADFDKLCSYLRDDVECCIEQPAQNCAWWLYFCGVHRGRSQQELERFRAAVMNGPDEIERALLEWTDQLYDTQQCDLQPAIDRFVSVYSHREPSEGDMWERLCFRCSILLNLTRRFEKTGIRPDSLSHMIVSFE